MNEAGDRCAHEGAEAWHVIEASMHDLRTPLGTMSGWLEVLEARLGDAVAPDAMTTRALQGLRRAIEQQTRLLEGYASVAATHRDWPRSGTPQPLAQALIAAIGQLDPAAAGRLVSLLSVPVQDSGQHPPCGQDANGRLVDALTVLLGLLANALGDGGRTRARVDAGAIVITARRASGAHSALAAFCAGPDKAAARAAGMGLAQLWSARRVLQRCGVVPGFDVDPDGEGFSLSLRAQAT